MNLYNEVQRVHDVRNRLRRILIRLEILDNTSTYDEEQLADRAGAGANLEEITETLEDKLGGNYILTNLQRANIASKNYVKAYDRNLTASNIKRGKNILGVAGTYNGTHFTPDTKSYTWIYGTSEIPPNAPTPSDASGYFEVIPQIATGNDLTLIPTNIRKGVDIMGVIGEYSFLNMNGAHWTGSRDNYHKLTLPLSSMSEAPSVGLWELTADQIQIGWVVLTDTYWEPPTRSNYYVYHMTFGRNPHDNNRKFLVIDTLLRRLNYQDRINRFYVDGAPYTVSHDDPEYGTTITFDLTNADFYCVDMHDCKIGSQPLFGLDDIGFDSGTAKYHVDVRW